MNAECLYLARKIEANIGSKHIVACELTNTTAKEYSCLCRACYLCILCNVFSSILVMQEQNTPSEECLFQPSSAIASFSSWYAIVCDSKSLLEGAPINFGQTD
ncbi:hypothetical protein PVAP13_8NG313184 [Panicum virgatum]|uniref:Uncharacterized protein n=1 Tax=Panicum virgatum TaxID=38727 RepID=A0A8T0PJB9_PANVG|nr:hypothetical protein PVAP13_8NG313184 [Panicum virgatum]